MKESEMTTTWPESIMAMLHNTATNKYHPILFGRSPLPSDDGEGASCRYKSIGHHTAGFDDRSDAVAFSYVEMEKRDGGLCLQKDFAWDSGDMPAMVVFFTRNQAGELLPAF